MNKALLILIEKKRDKNSVDYYNNIKSRPITFDDSSIRIHSDNSISSSISLNEFKTRREQLDYAMNSGRISYHHYSIELECLRNKYNPY